VAVSRYTVTAERSDKWWSLQCVEVPGAISQVAKLDQAADMIREAIAFVADVPEESIEIDVQPVLPRPVRSALEAADKARSEAARLTTRAAVDVRRAAVLLHADKLTNREIGVALGVSHQRVNQLLKEAPAAKESPQTLQEA